MEELEKELEELREYKTMREKQDTEAALFTERAKRIADAGLGVSLEDVETKKAYWLGLSDEDFETTLVLIKEIKPAVASVTPPDVSGDVATKSNIDLVREGFATMKQK